jgi:hypothetical protein
MKRDGLKLLTGLVLSVTCGAGLGCRAQARMPSSGPPQLSASNKSERESVAVTVYNQNFGVVRDVRRLRLGNGRVELFFKDVSAHLQPETVRLHSLTKGARFEVLEQNYRYDLLTPAKLLEKYVGKQISVYRYNEKRGSEEKKAAHVLSVEGGVTLRIDGEVTTNFQGRYAFSEVPANLLEKPTLVWLIDSDRLEQRVEVTYLTQNLDWRADYVLKLDATDSTADLNGWVTLDNRSGTSYEDAALRLVAGDVNRVPAPGDLANDQEVTRAEESRDDQRQFKEEGLFEYHLYSLQRTTTLLDKETKQVSLLAAEGIGVKKKLVFVGQPQYFRGRYGQLVTNQKLGVFVELANSRQNHLGMPLPKGTVRVYKADQSGALQFVGEDAIDHTPRDEKVAFKLGEAFDVVGDRVQKDWTQLSNCSAESAFEIEIRNHKDVAQQVEISEPAGADWQLLQHSHPFVKVDSTTFRFDVSVQPRQSTRVSYRIRVRYC